MVIALLLGIGLLILPALLIGLSRKRCGRQKTKWVLISLLFPVVSLLLANIIGFHYLNNPEVANFIPWVSALGYVGAWGVYLASVIRPVPAP